MRAFVITNYNVLEQRQTYTVFIEQRDEEGISKDVPIKTWHSQTMAEEQVGRIEKR